MAVGTFAEVATGFAAPLRTDRRASIRRIMGLLDAWSRRAMERREGTVEFLGEQSGSVEDTLKRELILEFATRPVVRRAYLARVGYQSSGEPAVALCIISTQPDDRSLVLRVGEIVRRRFARDVPLDVLFLTAEQEREIAAVCSPFYSTAS
ncbi:MAG TPA: enhanced serine sensitivity protein SseB C-terminal domain-containing protein [Gemmatimonadaceae bacterium]|nr:enhanced serine sensitivity protein SseB C-terminal domain-containing protein [Gemmatimonadaceae bacterium]